MKRKVLGKTSLRVSNIALGGRGLCEFVWKDSVSLIYQAMEEGINFIDTSAEIRSSEDRIGDAFLVSRPGMHVFFSTRASAHTIQDMTTSIATSLGQLKRKTIDLYSIAGITATNSEQLMGPRGSLAALTQAKNSKKIKYIGFETADVDVAIELLDTMVFDIAIIPAGKAARPFIEGNFMIKARKRGIGILAIEPENTEDYDRFESLKILQKYGNIVPVVDIRTHAELEELTHFYGKKRAQTSTPRKAKSSNGPVLNGHAQRLWLQQ